DLDALYAATDVLAITSYTEGIPNVLLEAFAYGKPAAATAVGGVPEVLEEGKTGFLVRPGEPAAMADRLVRLLGDDQGRRTFGDAARRCVEQRFSFEARTSALQRIYDECVLTKLTTRAGLTRPVS